MEKGIREEMILELATEYTSMDAVRRAYFKGVTDTLTLNRLESENNGQQTTVGTLACDAGTPRCSEKGERGANER